jgi:hypothetical protein
MVQHKYIVILIPWEKFVPVQLYDYVTSLELVLFIATTMGKFGRHAKKPIIEDEEEVYHVGAHLLIFNSLFSPNVHP